MNNPEPDYERTYDGSPGIGDFVEFVHAGEHLSGPVVDIIAGCVGPLLAVRVSPGRTVDMHWQRVRPCDMPEDWPAEPPVADAKAFIEGEQGTCQDMLDDRR
jgi:hypothetical protein